MNSANPVFVTNYEERKRPGQNPHTLDLNQPKCAFCTYRSNKVISVAAGTPATGGIDRVDNLWSAAVRHHVPIRGSIVTAVLETSNFVTVFDVAPCTSFYLNGDGF